MTFSVIIATLGRPAILRETLASIVKCDPLPDEVIVVDGGVEQSGARIARQVIPHARCIASREGLTCQRNAGIAVATSDILVFLDDDVTVPADLFARLADPFGQPDVVGATGHVVEPSTTRIGGPGAFLRTLLIRAEEGKFTRFGYPAYLVDQDAPRDVEFMPGCIMATRREAAVSVGFDESLEGYALAEDEDFSYRLSKIGRIRYVPEARIIHRKTGFQTRDPRSFGRKVVVNRAYLFRKNFPQSRLARAEFAFFILLLLGHRLANRSWLEALGIVDGARTVLGLSRVRSPRSFHQSGC